MSELQKFDPSKLMDGVRERIKATFVSLIPDDQWEQLCKREVDEFFRDKERGYKQDYYSDFSKVVNEVLTTIAKQKITQFLEQYDSTIWTEDGFKMSDKLGELIISRAPEIFAASIGNMFQNAIHQMKRY